MSTGRLLSRGEHDPIRTLGPFLGHYSPFFALAISSSLRILLKALPVAVRGTFKLNHDSAGHKRSPKSNNKLRTIGQQYSHTVTLFETILSRYTGHSGRQCAASHPSRFQRRKTTYRHYSAYNCMPQQLVSRVLGDIDLSGCLPIITLQPYNCS